MLLPEELTPTPTLSTPTCFTPPNKPLTEVPTPTSNPTPSQQRQREPNGECHGEFNYPCTSASRITPTPLPKPIGVVLLIFIGYVCETPNGAVSTKQIGFNGYVFAPLLGAVVTQFIGLNNGLIGYEFGATVVAIVLTNRERLPAQASARLTTQIGFVNGVIGYVRHALLGAVVATMIVKFLGGVYCNGLFTSHGVTIPAVAVSMILGFLNRIIGFEWAVLAVPAVVATLEYKFKCVLSPLQTGFEFEYGIIVPPAPPFDITLKYVEKEREKGFEFGVPTPATDNDNCFDNELQAPTGAVSILVGFVVCVVGYCFGFDCNGFKFVAVVTIISGIEKCLCFLFVCRGLYCI